MRSVLRPAATVVVLLVSVLLIASSSVRLLAGAAQAGAYWTCPMDKDVQDSKPGKCPKCGMALVKVNADGTPATTSPAKPSAAKTPVAQKAAVAKGVPYWKCFMDPEVESPTPGTCPKCGMALTKVNADGTPYKASPAEVKAAAAKAAKAAAAAAAKPGSATLAFHTDPAPLQVGKTDFMVMVKDANHELVADATVTVVMTLPADAPGGAATRIDIPMTAAEHGIYRGNARVPKKGPWTFTVDAKRGTFRLGTMTETRVAER